MIKGWRLHVNGTVLELTPELKELNEKLSEAVEKFQDHMADVEESLLIRSANSPSLERLIKLARAELQRRKKIQL